MTVKSPEKPARIQTIMCPFHKDTHPSMIISPEKGIAQCFCCDSTGKVILKDEKVHVKFFIVHGEKMEKPHNMELDFHLSENHGKTRQ